jgi:hypothetical protein
MTMRAFGWGLAALALLAVMVLSLRRETPTAEDGAEQPLASRLEALESGDALLALWAAGEQRAAAAPHVPAILEHLEGSQPAARRLAAEALGKIGVRSAEVLQALREAHGQGDVLLDRAVELALAALGGGVVVGDEMPEAITWASTPCLEALELAIEQGGVRSEELPLLERCRQEARRHAARIEADRLFRLGEQAGANLVSSLPALPWLEHQTLWSPPFLLVALGERVAEPPDAGGAAEGMPRSLRPILERAPRFGALLESSAEVCQAVYRDVLARHGAALELRPLEDPYGGRADLPIHTRSFADGYPLTVWVFVGSLVMDRLSKEGPPGFWLTGFRPPPGASAFFDGDAFGRASVIFGRAAATNEAECVGLMAWSAAAAVQHGFLRQRRAWRNVHPALDPVGEAIHYQWAAWERLESGRVAPARTPWKFELLRALSTGYVARGKRPWFTLDQLFGFSDHTEAMRVAAERGFDPRDGREIAKAQAWAFAQFLSAHPDPERRAQWVRIVARRMEGGLAPADIRGLLGIRDEEDWEALEVEFAPWLDNTFSPPAPPADPAAAPK